MAGKGLDAKVWTDAIDRLEREEINASELAQELGVSERAVRMQRAKRTKAKPQPAGETPAPRDPEALARARQAMGLPAEGAIPVDAEPFDPEGDPEGDGAPPPPGPAINPEQDAIDLVSDVKEDLLGLVVDMRYTEFVEPDNPRVQAAMKPGALLRRAARKNADVVGPVADVVVGNPIALLLAAGLDLLRGLAKCKREAWRNGWRPKEKEGDKPKPRGKPVELKDAPEAFPRRHHPPPDPASIEPEPDDAPPPPLPAKPSGDQPRILDAPSLPPFEGP